MDVVDEKRACFSVPLLQRLPSQTNDVLRCGVHRDEWLG